MKTKILVVALLALTFSGCQLTDEQQPITSNAVQKTEEGGGSRVIVCNRAGSSVSVIDANTNSLMSTFSMPDGGEPMYVVHIPQAGEYWVGDRLNNRVLAFDENTNALTGAVDAGSGVFHMWAAKTGRFLFVVNDLDNTVSVIRVGAKRKVTDVPIPADLEAMGGKPHDIIASTNEEAFFVTVVGVTGVNDFVVKYSLATMTETARAPVGKDAHVALNETDDKLYVVCQNPVSGVYTLNRSDLSEADFDAFSGAHGVGIRTTGNMLFVSDLPGARIGVFDLSSGDFTGSVVNTPFPVAHNLAHTSSGKLYCTHSGATADQVTIYDVSSGTPVLESDLVTGLNPFGITTYDL